MPHGLQVFDSSGAVVVDVVDRLTRFHSDYTVFVGGGGTLDVAVPGISTDGTWAVLCGELYFGYEIFSGFIRVHNYLGSGLSGYFQVLRI